MWVLPRPRSWLLPRPAHSRPGPGRPRPPRDRRTAEAARGRVAERVVDLAARLSLSATGISGAKSSTGSVVAADLPLAARLHLDRLGEQARVSPVISTGSPVSRVADSTREARLTGVADHAEGEPPGAADRPATTLPVFTPIPTSKPPGRRLLIVRASSTAHCTARSAWWGIRSGRRRRRAPRRR